MAGSERRARYKLDERGVRHSLDYRIYLRCPLTGQPISIWHDVPLTCPSDQRLFNMVVEVPRYATSWMVVALKEQLNPLKQHQVEGKLNFFPNLFPFHGCQVNFGFLPQTWQSPAQLDGETRLPGNSRPVRVFEVGERRAQPAEVVQIKLLGAFATVVNDSVSWTVLALDVRDPIADLLHDVDDLVKYKPWLVRMIQDWFHRLKSIYVERVYKVQLFFYPNGHPKDRVFAEQRALDSHRQWFELVNCQQNGFVCSNDGRRCEVDKFQVINSVKIGKPKLKPASPITAYTDVEIETLGTASVSVNAFGQMKRLSVYVVKKHDSSLFGIDWVLAFRLGLPPGTTIRYVKPKQLQSKPPDAKSLQLNLKPKPVQSKQPDATSLQPKPKPVDKPKQAQDARSKPPVITLKQSPDVKPRQSQDAKMKPAKSSSTINLISAASKPAKQEPKLESEHEPKAKPSTTRSPVATSCTSEPVAEPAAAVSNNNTSKPQAETQRGRLETPSPKAHCGPTTNQAFVATNPVYIQTTLFNGLTVFQPCWLYPASTSFGPSTCITYPVSIVLHSIIVGSATAGLGCRSSGIEISSTQTC